MFNLLTSDLWSFEDSYLMSSAVSAFGPFNGKGLSPVRNQVSMEIRAVRPGSTTVGWGV